jgi:mono/diheme cytochrome c family protein
MKGGPMKRDQLRHHFPSVTFVTILLAIIVLGAVAFIWFGIYNIAADAPHTRPVYAMIESLRDRSIAVHARDIQPPADLNSPQRISAGAGLYTEMCTGCHLGPGIEPSEMSQGLYPQAPDLATHHDLTAAEQFWVIKHGIKLTAMPAWGKTHPDPLVWDMVAFVRQLPGMSAEEYKTLAASAPEDHDEMMKDMGGAHGH